MLTYDNHWGKQSLLEEYWLCFKEILPCFSNMDSEYHLVPSINTPCRQCSNHIISFYTWYLPLSKLMIINHIWLGSSSHINLRWKGITSITFTDIALTDAFKYWSPWTIVSGVGGRLLLYAGYKVWRKFRPSNKNKKKWT